MLMMIAALLLPWLVGTVLVSPCWARGSAGRWPAMLGYGYFFGMALALALFWWLQQRSGEWQVGLVLGLLAVVLTGFCGIASPTSRSRRACWCGHECRSDALAGRFSLGSPVDAARITLLLLWSGLVGTEIGLRPVFPWDAWETWSYVAKTANAHPEAMDERRLQMRLDQSRVPLLQVWQAQAFGQWHAGVVNLPWWLCGHALLLALFGQLRYAGTSFIGSLIIVVLLALTPLFTTNVALGGYPELWTCSLYALAVMAACLAVTRRCWQQAALLLISSMMLVFTDRYAAGFSVLLWLAVLLTLMPWRWSLLVLLASLVSLVGWVFTTGIDFNIPKLGRLIVSAEQVVIPKARAMQFDIAEAPWADAARRLYLDATWGLSWILMAVATVYSVRHWHEPALRLLVLLVWPTFTLIMAMLLFSRLHLAISEGTGINRWLLPLLPVMAFWIGLAFGRPRKIEDRGQSLAEPAQIYRAYAG